MIASLPDNKITHHLFIIQQTTTGEQIMASPIKPEELETLGGGYALWGIYPQDKSRSRFWIESPEGLVVTKSYAWAFDARIEAVKAGYIPAEEAGFLPMQLCSTVRELLAGR